MKLLYCRACKDMRRVLPGQRIACECGLSACRMTFDADRHKTMVVCQGKPALLLALDTRNFGKAMAELPKGFTRRLFTRVMDPQDPAHTHVHLVDDIDEYPDIPRND